jgi:hypothetical protein
MLQELPQPLTNHVTTLPEASVDILNSLNEALLLSMVRPLSSVNLNDVIVEVMSVYGKFANALPVSAVVNSIDRAYGPPVQYVLLQLL